MKLLNKKLSIYFFILIFIIPNFAFSKNKFIPNYTSNEDEIDFSNFNNNNITFTDPQNPYYIQRINPTSPGYVQDVNPLMPGFIQDINPLSPGYVEDKQLFGFDKTTNSFGNDINTGLFGQKDNTLTDIFGNQKQGGMYWNPYESYSDNGMPLNNDGLFGGGWQSFGDSNNQTFGITDDKTFGGGINQKFGGSSSNTFGGSDNTFGYSFNSD
jgi:hypothetical protein